jgi:Bacterial aa3 type cytochrome c oxidase subunit IV
MAEQQDISAATGTYSGFLKLLKWGVAVSVITTAVVVLIISR